MRQAKRRHCRATPPRRGGEYVPTGQGSRPEARRTEESGSLRPITRHGAAHEREAKNRMSLLGLAWLPPIRGRRDGR